MSKLYFIFIVSLLHFLMASCPVVFYKIKIIIACNGFPGNYVELSTLFFIVALLTGQIQRQMLQSGQLTPSKVVNTLVEAVQCTFISDHDLG